MSTAIPNELVVIACGRAVIGEKERLRGKEPARRAGWKAGIRVWVT